MSSSSASWPTLLSFVSPSSFWQSFLTRSMMWRRWSLNPFCCTSAPLSTMLSSCWWADRYSFTCFSIYNGNLIQIDFFFVRVKSFACCCFSSCRGRWASPSNSLTVWCDFTDPGCLRGTASSLSKLWTLQGLRCSGDASWKSPPSNFTEHSLTCVRCATVYRTFINSMRSPAWNGR